MISVKLNRRRTLLRVAQGLVVPFVLLLAWQLAVTTNILPPSLVAPPSKVFPRFLEMIWELEIFENAFSSLKRLLIGYVIGVICGIALGTFVGASKRVARFVEPTVLSLIPVPAIAWIPLLIILFGLEDKSKIMLLAIGSFCVLFIHTAYGIRSVDNSLIEVAKVLNKSRNTILWKILLPAASPNILSSMRVAMALSWTLLVASEVIASTSGLGWLIWTSRNFSRPADMIAGMIAIGILGKLTDSLLVRLDKYWTRWRTTYDDMPYVYA